MSTGANAVTAAKKPQKGKRGGQHLAVVSEAMLRLCWSKVESWNEVKPWSRA